MEEYFPGRTLSGDHVPFDRKTIHEQHSVTKSVNATLIGIAIDQGLIRDVDEKISSFFPEYTDIFEDPEKDQIRVRHLLSMTAGLAWDEHTYPYTDSRNDHIGMNRSRDPIRYVLERPLVAEPGKTFVYNSGLAITLGGLIYNTSGLRADVFAKRYLFAPLGITEYYWERYPNGTIQTGGGLYLRPRDMAKIGHLMLNGGRWQDEQIMSEAWCEEAVKQHAPDQGYGYQWWLFSFEVNQQVVASYSAWGRGGQFIFVFPSVDVIAVFTGGNDNALANQPFEMVEKYVLPAVL